MDKYYEYVIILIEQYFHHYVFEVILEQLHINNFLIVIEFDFNFCFTLKNFNHSKLSFILFLWTVLCFIINNKYNFILKVLKQI